MALTNPMMNLLLNVGLTLVSVVGAYRVNAGVSSAVNIIAFLSYFTIILNAMMAVTRIFVMCSKGIASGARIQEVLDTPEDLRAFLDADIRGGRMWKVGPLKLFLDGSLGARSAWMRRDYADEPGQRGLCCLPYDTALTLSLIHI